MPPSEILATRQMARAAAVAAVIAALAVAFSLPLSAGVSKGELCKLGGTRHAGKTSQGKSMCFTLTRAGKISEYAYAFSDNCGAGTSRTTSKTGIPVAATGSFSTTFSGSFFKGKIRASRASGTLRSKRTEYGGYTPTTCNTGVLRWNATRR
jgi:hypothetical protein